MSWTKVLTGFSLMLLALEAYSAIENSKIYNERGLSLSIKNPSWIFLSPSEIDSQGTLFVARPKNHSKMSLTWRIDNPEVTTADAKKYAEKWLKDYPKFGFELESSGNAKYGALDGFEIELKNVAGGQKLKQFIIEKNKEFWIFTCSARLPEFETAWNGCKKILLTAKLAK